MRVIDITMLFGKLPNNVHFAAPPSSVLDTWTSVKTVNDEHIRSSISIFAETIRIVCEYIFAFTRSTMLYLRFINEWFRALDAFCCCFIDRRPNHLTVSPLAYISTLPIFAKMLNLWVTPTSTRVLRSNSSTFPARIACSWVIRVCVFVSRKFCFIMFGLWWRVMSFIHSMRWSHSAERKIINHKFTHLLCAIICEQNTYVMKLLAINSCYLNYLALGRFTSCSLRSSACPAARVCAD